MLLRVHEEGSGYKGSARDRLSHISPFYLVINRGSIQKLLLTFTSFPIYHSGIILPFNTWSPSL